MDSSTQNTKDLAIIIEKRKILFQFSLMVVAAVIGGFYFAKVIGASTSPNIRDKILEHFTYAYPSDYDFSDLLCGIIKSCMPYFILTVTVFVFSFSYVNYIVSDLILAIIGFITGFSIAIVAAFSYKIGMLSMILFAISMITSLLVMLYFTFSAALFSLEIRTRATNGRIILNPRKLLLIIVKMLAVLGTFVIFTFVRCLTLLF